MDRGEKTYIILLFFLVSSVVLLGQNATVSPYSRFALGELDDNIPAMYRAMGGVRYGMRNHLTICPAQPASYTACDSLTFMFDFSAHLSANMYRDASGKRTKLAGNLDYVTMQFPLWKRHLAFSVGIMPYSSVGYDFYLSDSINSDYHYYTLYAGEGGITDLYVGLGGNIKDWVALGFNMYYMFGKVTNARSLIFSETNLTSIYRITEIHVSSLRFRYGLQVFHSFDTHDFTVGAIFEHKTSMKGEYSESSSEDTLEYAKNKGVFFPMVFGVGVSYRWKKRLSVAFDYEQQQWGKSTFLDDYTFGRELLKNSYKIALGLEYQHSPIGKNYAERMIWRVGANLNSSYISSIKTPGISVSLGFGFPFRTVGSTFNFCIEYTRRGNVASLIENEIRTTFNIGIRENWFFKRKL